MTAIANFRTHAEVLVRFPGSLDTPQQDGVRTSGGAGGKLVEGKGLTAGGDDALLRSLGESQRGDGDLGEGGHAGVIGDGADLDDDLVGQFGGIGGLFDDAGEGQRGAVVFGEEKTVQDHLIIDK
jgi:hypothetical protein